MRLFGKVAEFSAAFALFVLVVVTIGAVFMRYFISNRFNGQKKCREC